MRKVYCFALVLLVSLTVNAEVLYDIIDLGKGTAWSVNNNGQAVGTSSGRATLFDTTGGGNNIALGGVAAFSINDSGQIVGYAEVGSYIHHAMLFDPTGQGNNIDLTPSATTPSYARSINIHGQIVGETFGQAVVFDSTGDENHVYLGAGSAHSINDNGQIVGQQTEAILYDPTGQQANNVYLGSLGGGYSCARSINESGQIVGFSRMASPIPQNEIQAAMFDPTGNGDNIDLGKSGFSQSDAMSINNLGQIVGIFGDNENAALFDQAGNNINLNTLIEQTLGWDLKVANSITDYGQIVGYGFLDGEQHAYLLTPIPEPTTLLLLGMGGVLIKKRK